MQSLVPSAVCEFEEPIREAISGLFGLYTSAIGDGFQRYRASDGLFPENLGAMPCTRPVRFGGTCCRAQSSPCRYDQESGTNRWFC